MTAPGCGGADGVRAELAAALRGTAHVCGWDVPCPCYDWNDEESDAAVHATAVSAGHVDEVQGIPEAFADALLPTVQALIAAELRSAAEIVARTPGIKHQARAVSALRDRADALDGTP